MPEFYKTGQLLIAGCDEAGRGCLAGPVVAAAVILPADYGHPLLNDSKQVTSTKRDLLNEDIRKNALAFAIGVVDNLEIDRINILKASITAMHRAVAQLMPQPEHLIIDGNRFYPYPNIPHTTFIKGDSRYTQIAAASILAKTHRDALMLGLHEQHPQYDWATNKGYPTKAHRAAIRANGPTDFHRMTFKLLPPEQPELFEEK